MFVGHLFELKENMLNKYHKVFFKMIVIKTSFMCPKLHDILKKLNIVEKLQPGFEAWQLE